MFTQQELGLIEAYDAADNPAYLEGWLGEVDKLAAPRAALVLREVFLTKAIPTMQMVYDLEDERDDLRQDLIIAEAERCSGDWDR